MPVKREDFSHEAWSLNLQTSKFSDRTSFETEYESAALLAFLDVTIITKDTDKSVALIEIAETTFENKY